MKNCIAEVMPVKRKNSYETPVKHGGFTGVFASEKEDMIYRSETE